MSSQRSLSCSTPRESACSAALSPGSLLPPPATAPVPMQAMCGIPLKYIALLLLVVQTVAVVITLRFSRISSASSSSPRYLNTTAVTASEIMKLLSCVCIVFYESGPSRGLSIIRQEVLGKPWDTLKVGLPAFLYTVQNNLIFISLSNLSGALYQVTYQLKILTTAILSVALLKRHLGVSKWVSLFILTFGVVLIQIPADEEATRNLFNANGNTFIGLAAVLAACCTSGLAGVYFEMILKQSNTSIWVRNIQLGVYGSILGALAAFWNDSEAIRKEGFFQGYNGVVWTVVLLQAVGGLVVAAVLKYADNILKCFGNAASIALSCLLCYYLLGDFQPTQYFGLGTALVILATYMYGVDTDWKGLLMKGVPTRYKARKDKGKEQGYELVGEEQDDNMSGEALEQLAVGKGSN